MPTRQQQIRTIFSYTESEREVFPYLDRYMRLVEPRLDAVLADPAATRRFMLAGLFLTYRACNHTGQPMSTHIEQNQLPEIDIERLKTFALFTDETFESTSQYLNELKFTPIWKWELKTILFGLGRILYKYVITEQRQ